MAGLEVDDALVRLGCHDADSAETATRELLALPRPPTAVFACNNRITVGVLHALAGRRKPVALVGFDDFELAELLAVPVTVVAASPLELGREAATLLTRRLGGSDEAPRTIVLPTTLVARGSGEVAP